MSRDVSPEVCGWCGVEMPCGCDRVCDGYDYRDHISGCTRCGIGPEVGCACRWVDDPAGEREPLAYPTDGEIHSAIDSVVRLLLSAGFRTTDSGDGVTHVAEGMEGAIDVPHVFVRVAPDDLVEEVDRMAAVLTAAGVVFTRQPPWLPRIEGSYSTADGVAVIALLGVTDDMLEDERPDCGGGDGCTHRAVGEREGET